MTDNYESQYTVENINDGGFGWDGKVVTVTGAKLELLLSNEGKLNGFLVVKGIAEGEDAEYDRRYFLPWGSQPSADGLFLDEKDKPGVAYTGKLSRKKDMGRFIDALVQAKFDMSRLKKPAGISGLIGTRIKFEAIDRIDREGKVVKNNKNFVQQDYYPKEVRGYVGGKPGNGSDVSAEAQTVVLAAVKEAGGTLTRQAIIGALNKSLGGNAHKDQIISLAISDAFLKTVPGVSYANSTLTAQ